MLKISKNLENYQKISKNTKKKNIKKFRKI